MALGKIHCLYGFGGVGKTTILIDIIARLTTGRDWPDGSPGGPPVVVVYVTAEDGLSDTLLPRLKAAGGNPEMVHVLSSMYEHNGVPHFFNLGNPDCLRFLEMKLREIDGVKLLVIDPITAFLGGVDSHNSGDVRSVLFPLTRLAEQLLIAILYIHHFNKASGQNALHRASGSTAFTDAVRIAMMACANPDGPEERRVLKVTKSNLGIIPAGLGYSIHSLPGTNASHIVWEEKPIEKSANELLILPGSIPFEPTEGVEAFLLEALSEGSRMAIEVIAEAKAAGFSEKEIRTAREKLKVKPKREGFGDKGKWRWTLPGDLPQPIDAIDAHIQDEASMGNYDGESAAANEGGV